MWITNVVRHYLNKVIIPTRSDILSLQRLSDFNLKFLPSSIAAMRPAGINIILNDIIVNQRTSIVEFGSGISTLYISSLLKQKGKGQFISFEHDNTWIEIVKEMLEDNGLSEYVCLKYAPLSQEHPWVSDSETAWYDYEIVHQTLFNTMIDLLIVDGPPASGFAGKRRKSRLPALFAVESYLSSSCTVVLDDFNRIGEKMIIKYWLDKLDKSDFQLYDYTLEARLAYLRRGSGYSVSQIR